MLRRELINILAGTVLIVTMLVVPGAAQAQADDQGGHLGHHPGGGGPPVPAASAQDAPDPSSAPPGGGMGGGGMGGMMKGMMGAPPPHGPAPGPGVQSGDGMSVPAAPGPDARPVGETGMGDFRPGPGAAGREMGKGGPSAGSGKPFGGGGCGGGAGCAGGGRDKPFYPALMNMPLLTPDARRIIETEAAKRLGAGAEAITTGEMPLHQALSVNDPAAIQQAIAGVRQGVMQVESGASALQAVNQAQPPRLIALTWFNSQMSTAAAAEGVTEDDGPWGLSWFHLGLMLFLVACLLVAILAFYARSRRIGQLAQQLTPGAPPAAAAGGSKSTPSAAGAASPPTAGAAPPAAASGAAPLGAGPKPLAPVAGASPSPPAAEAKPPAPAAGASPPPPPAAGAQPPLPAQGSKPAASPGKPWSGKLRVGAIFQETHNVKTFHMIEQDGSAIPFTFLPGQFLAFATEVDGKRIHRSYTIASSPAQRNYVEITVKREDQGMESRYLHDTVAVGDLLEVTGPSGVFTFTGTEAESIVLIAGGIGITPMMCILRYLTDIAFPGDIFFLYGARKLEDFIFCEELEYLKKRHANLHFKATMETAEKLSWTGAVGKISKEFIADAVPEIAHRRVHVCGPPVMMEAVKTELGELGVPKDKIKTEAFGPTLGSLPGPPSAAAPESKPAPAAQAAGPASPAGAAKAPAPAADAAPPATPAAATPAAAPAPPAGAAAATPAAAPAAAAQVEVQFTKSGKTGPLAPDQPVLEAAEAIGVVIDFSCRVGICGVCVVPLTKGTVTMAVQDGLRPEDKARGIVLACQAKSPASLVVDA
jgi:ferredoxin-NADP reductase/ferredoxin